MYEKQPCAYSNGFINTNIILLRVLPKNMACIFSFIMNFTAQWKRQWKIDLIEKDNRGRVASAI